MWSAEQTVSRPNNQNNHNTPAPWVLLRRWDMELEHNKQCYAIRRHLAHSSYWWSGWQLQQT